MAQHPSFLVLLFPLQLDIHFWVSLWLLPISAASSIQLVLSRILPHGLIGLGRALSLLNTKKKKNQKKPKNWNPYIQVNAGAVGLHWNFPTLDALPLVTSFQQGKWKASSPAEPRIKESTGNASTSLEDTLSGPASNPVSVFRLRHIGSESRHSVGISYRRIHSFENLPDKATRWVQTPS